MDNKIVDIGIDLLENPNKKKRKDLAFFNIVTSKNKKTIPEEFICPLSKNIMTEPVIIADGSVFERREIINWFKNNNTNPLTFNPIDTKIIIPNINLKKLIKKNYSCYETDIFNEQLLYLIREKLYNKTPIYSTQMDEHVDNMLTTLIKFLKCNQNTNID